MAIKLYIFRPSISWINCGGAIIVAADDFKEVLAIAAAYNKGEQVKADERLELSTEFNRLAEKGDRGEKYRELSQKYYGLPDPDPIVEKFCEVDPVPEADAWVLERTFDLKYMQKAGIIHKSHLVL